MLRMWRVGGRENHRKCRFLSSFYGLVVFANHGTLKLPEIIDAVLNAMTFARQAEVQAWEQEITPCEHTLCLEQDAEKKLESQSMKSNGNCAEHTDVW
jgi:hypothetical protein